MKQEAISPVQAELAKITDSLADRMRSFDPAGIYYDSQSGVYFVDVGTHYRQYGRKLPVKSGVKRYLEEQDIPTKEIPAQLNYHMEVIEIDHAVDWSGEIAGFERGVRMFSDRRILVTKGYDIPEPRAGACPAYLSILRQAFPDSDALNAFLGWLQGGYHAILASCHQPAPMAVLAGQKGAGKSLLALITKYVFGNRVCNPMTAWMGDLVWNDNLLKSELHLIDDSVGTTDMRMRKRIGAKFKESNYARDVEINTRNKSSISMRPVWRTMVCCNETPENLSVIPPLEEGIEDKIMLLKVSPVETPVPATTPEEKKAFRKLLRDELPAFLAFLDKFKLPEHLNDPRSGVTAWKDTELLQAISELQPETHLEHLLVTAISANHLFTDLLEEKWMTAAEVQDRLQDYDSPVSQQARGLLNYHTNAGKYLAALEKRGCKYVTGKKTVNGTAQYKIQKG